jgi:Tol biopolymer transport system component
MELKDGVWTKPHLAPFADLVPYNFTVSPDSNTLYFTSIRDPEDHEKILKQANIWIVHYTGSGWTEPEMLGNSINSDKFYENYPSVTQDGTVYYMLNHPTGYGRVDVCRSRPDGCKFHSFENIDKPVNSEFSEADPFIAPDESYVIFCSQKPGGYGKFDMYISFRDKEDNWAEPINMGPEINSAGYEFRPCLTPDGKYLFFTRGDEGWDHVYWVDAKIIDDLKPATRILMLQ